MFLIVTLLAAAAPPLAWGNDRPFQMARTAVLEDDENVWSFESWAQRFGSVRGLSVEPEYTFEAGTSAQVELSRFSDRAGSETGHEAEVEFKQLFNNVARDGWGWGISAAFGVAHTRENGTVRSLGLKLPLSIALGEGGGYLHLNAGLTKASDARRSWTAGAGVEREVFKRTMLFGELVREGGETFAQIGARHWLRRDKLAVDVSLQRRRTAEQRGRRASSSDWAGTTFDGQCADAANTGNPQSDRAIEYL